MLSLTDIIERLKPFCQQYNYRLEMQYSPADDYYYAWLIPGYTETYNFLGYTAKATSLLDALIDLAQQIEQPLEQPIQNSD
jgi:hypothetical protein